MFFRVCFIYLILLKLCYFCVVSNDLNKVKALQCIVHIGGTCQFD